MTPARSPKLRVCDALLLTPGPTPLPPQVRAALSRPLVHHRSRDFIGIFNSMTEGLKWVFRTKNDVLTMASSGTGAMESAVANLLSPEDEAIVHSTGHFGDRFAAILKAYGLSPVVISEPWGKAADPEKTRAALKAHPGAKAVFFQQTDTSTGILNDVRELSRTVRENSGALVVVDAISSLGGERLETDEWGLDVVLSASQKGLENAPGLAFAAVSERAWRQAESARLPRFYFDWRTTRKFLPESQTPYTPAIALIAAQAEALNLLKSEGLESVWKRTQGLARVARDWAEKNGLQIFPESPADIMTVFRLADGLDGQKIVADILKEERISLAGGQGALKGRVVRVAHMGHIGRADLMRGLKALGKRLDAAAPLRPLTRAV